jgi:hypothetical protein
MSTTVKPRKDHPTEPIDEPPHKAARTKSTKTVKKEEDVEQVTERKEETLIWPAPPEQLKAAREFILEALILPALFPCTVGLTYTVLNQNPMSF